jgi:hypothetical protein
MPVAIDLLHRATRIVDPGFRQLSRALLIALSGIALYLDLTQALGGDLRRAHRDAWEHAELQLTDALGLGLDDAAHNLFLCFLNHASSYLQCLTISIRINIQDAPMQMNTNVTVKQVASSSRSRMAFGDLLDRRILDATRADVLHPYAPVPHHGPAFVDHVRHQMFRTIYLHFHFG